MISKIGKSLAATILLLSIFCGCISDSEPSFEIKGYEFKDDNGSCVVEVTVSGEADCEAVLVKDANELDNEYVTERQLEDGREVIMLELTNNYETPSGGNFSITIYHDSDQMTSTDFYKFGPYLYITNFDPTFDSGYSDYMEEMSITYENTGDLPAYVSEIYFVSNYDESRKDVSESSQYIAPGEEVTLGGSTYLEVASGWYSTRSIVIGLLNSDGDILGSYTWEE